MSGNLWIHGALAMDSASLFASEGVFFDLYTTLSNQMSRKKKNSILRSIGLTGKRLCRMNIVEGMCYAFLRRLQS